MNKQTTVGFVTLFNSAAVFYFAFLFFFFQLCMYLFEQRIPAPSIQQQELVGFVFDKSAEL